MHLFKKASLYLFIHRFEKRSRNFNYYRYFTADRVVHKSDTLAVALQKSFDEVNETLYKDVDEIYLAVNSIKDSIQEFRFSAVHFNTL